MDMSDTGNSTSSDSMGMGSGSEHACKISMMWNWCVGCVVVVGDGGS